MVIVGYNSNGNIIIMIDMLNHMHNNNMLYNNNNNNNSNFIIAK